MGDITTKKGVPVWVLSLVVPVMVALALALVPGLIGYGSLKSEVETAEKKSDVNTRSIKENRDAIKGIKETQIEMKTRSIYEAREQERFRQENRRVMQDIQKLLRNKVDIPNTTGESR